jgi:hypothetical protein
LSIGKCFFWKKCQKYPISKHQPLKNTLIRFISHMVSIGDSSKGDGRCRERKEEHQRRKGK